VFGVGSLCDLRHEAPEKGIELYVDPVVTVIHPRQPGVRLERQNPTLQ
jgi:hypothetical protein